MADNDQAMLPGMEEYFEDEGDEVYEGTAPAGYFDAALLPDAPPYQENAKGTRVYTLYVLFPTQDELKRGVAALTGGGRKQGLHAGVTTATVPSTKKIGKRTLLEFWEENLLGKEET